MINAIQLKLKLRKTFNVLKKALTEFPKESVALAWTGGKDSTLILWVLLKVCRENNFKIPKIMFINEGDIFPEVETFTKKLAKDWDFTFEEVKNDDVLKQVKNLHDKVYVGKLNKRNKDELKLLGFTHEFFYFEPESMVGNHLMKTVPMNLFIEKHSIEALITGIRRDEQEARAHEIDFSPRKDPDHIRVHPILHFREKDVWDATHANNIPYVDLYEKGYRSLGARSSTTKPSDIPAWKQDLDNTTERIGRRQDKEKIMEKLRKLGYM